MYKIIRSYFDHSKPKEVIKTGLTLDEVLEYCRDLETEKEGVYFDAFTLE